MKDSHPVLSSGIYNHFRVTVTEDGGTVKFVPNFLFGIPQSVLDTFYLGAEGGQTTTRLAELIVFFYLRFAHSGSVPGVSEQRQTHSPDVHGVGCLDCRLDTLVT